MSLRSFFSLHLFLPVLVFGVADVGLADDGLENIHLRAMLLDMGPARQVHFIGGKGFESVRVSSVQPSRAVTLRMANPLPVFFTPPVAGENGEMPRPDVTVPLPIGEAHILLLGMADGDHLRFVAIPDDLHSADNRDWRLINATDSPIVFRFGDDTEPLLIQPRSQRSYRITTKQQQGAAVSAAARIDGSPATFYSTYWPLQENIRGLVIFSEDGDEISVRRVSESTVPREDADNAAP